MSSDTDQELLTQLIEAAYRQTLASFDKEVAEGRRNPVEELAEYRRQRRDYASLLRSGRVPDEAKALADRLLESHGLSLPREARTRFESDVAGLLVRLYDAFILRSSSKTQGSR